MSQPTSDAHRLEERGCKRSSDISEDKLYSEVSIKDVWTAKTTDLKSDVALDQNKVAEPEIVIDEKTAIKKELEEIEKQSERYNDAEDKEAWTKVVISLLSKKRSLENRLQALNEEKKDLSALDKNASEKEDSSSLNKRNRGLDSRKRQSGSQGTVDGFKSDDSQKTINSKNARGKSSSRRASDSSKMAEMHSKIQKEESTCESVTPVFKDIHECVAGIKNSFKHEKDEENGSMDELPRSNSKYIGDLYSFYTKFNGDFEISPDRMNDIIILYQKDISSLQKKHIK